MKLVKNILGDMVALFRDGGNLVIPAFSYSLAANADVLGHLRLGEFQAIWGQTFLLGHASTDLVNTVSVSFGTRPFITADYTIHTSFRDNGGGAFPWDMSYGISSSPAIATTGFSIKYGKYGGATQFGYTAAAGIVHWVALGRWR